MADSESPASTDDLIRTATSWLDAEPDADIRDELSSLIAAARSGDATELADRFDGRLQFGTAGLRAAVAAGSMRMNRLVVRQAAAWAACHTGGEAAAALLERLAGEREVGVVETALANLWRLEGVAWEGRAVARPQIARLMSRSSVLVRGKAG